MFHLPPCDHKVESHIEWNMAEMVTPPVVSPAERAAMNKATNKLIYEKHLPSLKNLDVANPPLLVFLLGTHAMGKTTISKMLEEHLHAIRLNADDIRNILYENNIPVKRLNAYLRFCLNKLKNISPNGLIILDRSIGTRTYAHFNAISPTFLIQLEVPRSVVEERVRARNNGIQDLEKLQKSWENYEKFKATHQFDYVLDNSGNDFQVPQDLLDAIQKKLHSQ